jgi:hypothetical protein
MSTFPNRLLSTNGHNGHTHASAVEPLPAGADGGLADPDDETLRRELERLAAEHQELLASAGLAASPADEPAVGEPGEEAVLRAENADLRARVEELERQLAAAAQEREQGWAEQQREYEALLEEKSEVIRGLHLKVQELQQGAAPAAAAGDEPGASPALKDELLALREQLERERRQLREDEEAVEGQMKQMELTMSRERVELARQRSELQRLHNDFKHELEMAARDEKLRERLLPLQRLHQEVMNSKGTAVNRPASAAQLARPASVPNLAQPGPATPTPLPRRPASGLLRRLFGGKDE